MAGGGCDEELRRIEAGAAEGMGLGALVVLVVDVGSVCETAGWVERDGFYFWWLTWGRLRMRFWAGITQVLAFSKVLCTRS